MEEKQHFKILAKKIGIKNSLWLSLADMIHCLNEMLNKCLINTDKLEKSEKMSKLCLTWKICELKKNQ